jgi:hypothetical protein
MPIYIVKNGVKSEHLYFYFTRYQNFFTYFSIFQYDLHFFHYHLKINDKWQKMLT